MTTPREVALRSAMHADERLFDFKVMALSVFFCGDGDCGDCGVVLCKGVFGRVYLYSSMVEYDPWYYTHIR